MGLSVLVAEQPSAVGELWDESIERQLDNSQHLALVLGEEPSTRQEREAQYVLRQALDEKTQRRIIPIVTSRDAFEGMPSLLRTFAAYDLSEGSVEGAAVEVAGGGASMPGRRSSAVDAAREAVLHELYSQALVELQAGRPAGVALLDTLLAQAPGYRDAAALRDAARQKYRLPIGDQRVKLSRPRLVVFDLSEGLVGTESLMYEATRDVIRENSEAHHILSLDFYATYVGFDEIRFFSEMIERYQIEGRTPAELVREREERYRSCLQAADPGSLLKPRFLYILEQLSRRDVKMAICSTASRRRVQETLDRVGIAKYFTSYATPDQGTPAKPSPEMYVSLLREGNIRPEDCLVVESSLLGISASVSAGCYTVLLVNAFTAPVVPPYGVRMIPNSLMLADWFDDLLKAEALP